jgi:CheY-like chemotaxis protein
MVPLKKDQDYPLRVLVVDDEPVILQTMRAILETRGWQVRTAEDGFEGLRLLRETPPDLIISDLRMPNMSGFEFLAVVRRRFPHIPVIAVSGEFLSDGMPPGLLVDAFLQKGGYTPDQLFAKVEELIHESPIRPHLVKCARAPLWIPRRDAAYIVATCTECLRSFPIDDISSGAELRQTECPSCGTNVEYLVDSSVLKVLDQKKARLPSNQKPSLSDAG